MLLAQEIVQLHLHFKQPAATDLKRKGVGFAQVQNAWKRSRVLRCLLILKQACSSEYQRAQYAFKDSMIHWILQFTLRIAFRCVLHRCESQEIRCWKLYFELSIFIICYQTNVVKDIGWYLWRERKDFPNKHCTQGGYGFLKSAIKHSFVNDPSAGSPTETLLRLLLPLNDQVWITFQFLAAVASCQNPIRKPH